MSADDPEYLNELIREGYVREATLLRRADEAKAEAVALEGEVVALRRQLQWAVEALEEIERYFVGGWPDTGADTSRIRGLARAGLGKAPWPERGQS